MAKETDKSVMTLQKLVIIIGLVSSLVTATIGIGKEVAGVAKDWVVADNKVEVATLQEDVSKLKIEIENVRNQLNNNMIMALSNKTRDQQYVVVPHNPTSKNIKHDINFGWIMGIIGIIGLVTFGIWHHFHSKKHL